MTLCPEALVGIAFFAGAAAFVLNAGWARLRRSAPALLNVAANFGRGDQRPDGGSRRGRAFPAATPPAAPAQEPPAMDPDVKTADTKLAAAQKALTDAQLELAALRSQFDAPRAELAQIAALDEVSQADLLRRENLERKLRQLEQREGELAAAVSKAEGAVQVAETGLRVAKHAAARRRRDEHQAALLKRAAELEAELQQGIETLRRLQQDGDLSADTIALRLYALAEPSKTALERAGEALKLTREYGRYNNLLKSFHQPPEAA